MDALDAIFARASAARKKIALPESSDARILTAAKELRARGLAEIIFLGARAELNSAATAAGVNLDEFTVVNPANQPRADAYAEILRARNPDLSRDESLQKIRAPLWFAACMVANGDADGCVAGAVHTTAEVARAALKTIGAQPAQAQNHATDNSPRGLVSSFFIMRYAAPHQNLHGAAIFADCALVIDPTAEQLARIAADAADNARALLGLRPRVALLAFSTAGSARHASVDKVRRAGELIARARPDIELLAEVQFDAAVSPEILRRKAPAMPACAPANVFIFPDLQAGNIGYKIAERIGGMRAIGPVLQGLRRPMNDLSRGCGADDIVAMAAITAAQAS